MSIESQEMYFAQCCDCADQFDGDNAPSIAEAIQWARHEGWDISDDGGSVICPDCIPDEPEQREER